MPENETVYKILLVEDESGHADLILRVFEKTPWRYMVEVASTIKQAQEMFLREKPDLALVDYRLPDGLGVLIIELGKDTFPVVMMTSHGDEHIAVQAIKAGALDYIIKSPESFDKLPYVVTRALREWKLLLDKKTAEEVLHKSEENLKLVLRDINVGVILQGPKAEIFESNPKALKLLGISEDQLLGKTSFDPDWNIIHEDGSPFPGPTHPVPLAIATSQSVMGVIMGVYRPSEGNRVWLYVDAIPQLNDNGTIRQVVCSFIDITERKQIEIERERVIAELQSALDEVKTLSGIIPICANCKKIRDDKGYWEQVDSYVSHHTSAQFSHGICPDCVEKLYPEQAERMRSKAKE